MLVILWTLRSGLARGVEAPAVRPGRRDDRGISIKVGPPAAFVQKRVVVPADQDQIVQRGTAAVPPRRVHVMGVAPIGLPVAEREATAAIALHQRAAQRRRRTAGQPPYIQRLSL